MTRDEQFDVIAENVPKVYEAGYSKGYESGKAEGGEGLYEEGFEAGKKSEHDAFWDGFQNKGARRQYARGLIGYGFTFENFYPKYDIIIDGDGSQVFYAWEATSNSLHIKGSLKKRLEDCGVRLDTSKATTLTGLFNYNQFITEVPTIDFTGLTSASSGVFSNASQALTTIEKIITKESVTYSKWFKNDWLLVNVAFEGVIGQDIDFKDSSKLSKASIESIVSHLSDTASGKTLTLSKVAVDAFDDEVTAIPFGLTSTQEGANATGVDNGDGTATFNGTIEYDTYFDFGEATDVFKAGSYAISFPDTNQYDFHVQLYDLDGNKIDEYSYWNAPSEPLTFTADKAFVMKARLYAVGAYAFNNESIAYPTIRPDFETLKATKPNWTITEV
jgi:hypothetical protein